MTEVFWHNLSSKETFGLLRSDQERGLSEKEIEIRKRNFGLNKLSEKKKLLYFRK
ncbi:MAG: cation-transporting P-type ATPase [Patescibacteria group bacterium]|nr:cation-transporting P-type ATPase [Patescibacteria group bacterium]